MILAVVLVLCTVAVIRALSILDRRATDRDGHSLTVLVEQLDRIAEALEDAARLRPILNPPNRGVVTDVDKLERLRAVARRRDPEDQQVSKPVVVPTDL